MDGEKKVFCSGQRILFLLGNDPFFSKLNISCDFTGARTPLHMRAQTVRFDHTQWHKTDTYPFVDHRLPLLKIRPLFVVLHFEITTIPGRNRVTGSMHNTHMIHCNVSHFKINKNPSHLEARLEECNWKVWFSFSFLNANSREKLSRQWLNRINSGKKFEASRIGGEKKQRSILSGESSGSKRKKGGESFRGLWTVKSLRSLNLFRKFASVERWWTVNETGKN